VEEGHERGPDCELCAVSRLSRNAGQRFLTELVANDLTGLTGVDTYQRPMRWRLLNGVSRLLGSLGFVKDKMARIFLMSAVLNHPESRGTIKLSSADPHVQPVIDPNWLGDPRDVEKLKWYVYRLRDILRHPKMVGRWENVAFPLPRRDMPPSALLDESVTDEQIETHVRTGLATSWHYSCSVRMGPDGDETSACDPRLRIKGVRGLRCADASIMPVVNSANTNAVCMVIGSMCADFIAEEHGLGPRAGSGVSGVAPPPPPPSRL